MAVPLIQNPRARGGKGEKIARKAAALLAERGIDTQPMSTTRPLHARDLAERLAREGHERILVVGGDGTISEACEGVLRSGASPQLGFLPGGTGNSFLRSFDVKTMEQAADAISLGKARAVDAAHARWPGGERHFVNVFGTGFMAKVCDLANRRFKWLGGGAYNAAVFPELARFEATPTRLTLDGELIEERFGLVAVCNTVYTGKSMRMAPAARTDDGLLDVVALRDTSRAQLLKLFPRLFTGSHVRDERVLVRTACRVRIEPAQPSPLLGDGEVYGETPVDVEVRPGALQVLLPG